MSSAIPNSCKRETVFESGFDVPSLCSHSPPVTLFYGQGDVDQREDWGPRGAIRANYRPREISLHCPVMDEA